jgi:hypothetical protein
MVEQTLDKMNDDSEVGIHLSLRVFYNLLLAFEEQGQD